VASRAQSDIALVVDLRSTSLFAVSKARHRGRTLLIAALEHCVSARLPLTVLIASSGARQELLNALAAVAPKCRVGTFAELSTSLAAMGDVPILWLCSLVPGLDEADVMELKARHATSGGAAASPVHGSRDSPVCDALAGWIGRASHLPPLHDLAGREQADALRIARPVLLNLDDFAGLVRQERRERAEALLLDGVDLVDWASLEIAGNLRCAAGVSIGPHLTVEGLVQLETGVRIGSYVYLRDVTVGANTEIRAFSSIEDSMIGANCRVGPYARLRNRTLVDSDVSIGNFVELKATTVGSGGRINHFAFLGDAVLQADVTIGAGVITCNHDGEKSTATKIETGAYVGSGSELVAPLTVGQRSTIGAGSTITEDVKPGGLTVARARQVRVADWKRKGGK
jgi:acyl-[acyl carrier protein]--UDP-N-acetylglucosamine O-acyltransferase